MTTFRYLLPLPLFVLAACGGGVAWRPVAGPAAIPLPPGPRPRQEASPAPAARPKPKFAAISGALPPPADAAVLDRKAECKTGACKLGKLVPDSVKIGKDDKSPAVIWEQLIGKGASVAVPRDGDVDVLGIVMRGQVTLTSDGDKDDLAPVGMWHAFRAPGAGLSIKAKDGDARVVLIVATAGEPVAAAAAKLAAKAAEVGWKTRPGPIAKKDLTASPDLAWGGGAFHARLGFEGAESPRASLGVLLMSKNAAVADHAHDKEWEHLALLDALGNLETDEAKGPKVVQSKDGAVIDIAPGLKHEWKPAGVDPTLAIQVFTPAGPEQRFKKWASEAK